MKSKATKVLAGAAKKVVRSGLGLEANSTTCFVAYQPKEPTALQKLSKVRK